MNEFKKALETKKEKKTYKFKSYYTEYIILYPLMIIVYYWNKIFEIWENSLKWNDKKTEKILAYAFPKIAEVNKEEGSIGRYIRSWGVYVKEWHVKWYHKDYCSKYNQRIITYLIEQFEIDGFVKEVTVEDKEWTYIKFTKK